MSYGPGLQVELGRDARKSLKQRIEELERLQQAMRWTRRGAALVGGSLLLLAPIASLVGDWQASSVGAVAFYGGAALLLAYLASPQTVGWRLREHRSALEIGSFKWGRAAPALALFKNHEMELWRYYVLTLGHARTVLTVGIAAIVAGLAVVGTAIYIVFRVAPTTGSDGENVGEPWSGLVVGVLGAAGTIMSGYVATMYLQMHAATSTALNDFHQRLVTTHHVYFGYFLTWLVDDDAKRDDTLVTIAKDLVN